MQHRDYVKLRYPICGYDIAAIEERGSTDKGQSYTRLDLGKTVCRVLGHIECTHLDSSSNELLRFGKKRERVTIPYDELIPTRETPKTEEPLYDDDGNVYSSYCLCGCGAHVARAFLPGHDAKLKSRLNKLLALGDDYTVALADDPISPTAVEYILSHWRDKYGKLFA